MRAPESGLRRKAPADLAERSARGVATVPFPRILGKTGSGRLPASERCGRTWLSRTATSSAKRFKTYRQLFKYFSASLSGCSNPAA